MSDLLVDSAEGKCCGNCGHYFKKAEKSDRVKVCGGCWETLTEYEKKNCEKSTLEIEI